MNATKKTKTYYAIFNSNTFSEEEHFACTSLKEAKQAAQNYKRHNNIKGVTTVKRLY
ncbi:MAG: hypothetical protein NTZ85_06220 [Bacteroidia bacterium]|nr:hypothetical protein [Bacteroidia bacterium]